MKIANVTASKVRLKVTVSGKRKPPMTRIAMSGIWSKKASKIAIQPASRRYRRYLEDHMLAASTIESYLNRVKLFLEWAETDMPSTSQFDDYRKYYEKIINQVLIIIAAGLSNTISR
jgi:hypothetical protein